jgi:hypothetical protein
MNGQKIAVLFLGTVLIVGIITFQLRRRPGPAPRADESVIIPSTSPAAVPAAVPVEAPVAIPKSEAPPAVASAATLTQTVSIPAAGWDRNPFLTPKEIADLARPPSTIQIAQDVPPPTPAAALPQPEVTAIISNNQGGWAVVDSLVVRVGDRVGSEVVKEIRSEAIVLERDGKTREIPLKQ